VRASDTLLVEVQKKSAHESPRRSLRIFQQSEEETDGNVVSGNTSREAVVELINRKQFLECLHLIDPNLSEKEVNEEEKHIFFVLIYNFFPLFRLQIEKMFEEALDLAHETVLRSLELMWVRYIDSASNYNLSNMSGSPSIRSQSVTRESFLESLANDSMDRDDLSETSMIKPKGGRVLGTDREFWVNTKTTISQWTRPYFARLFRCQEIEIDIFIQILIRRDVFPKRYYCISYSSFYPFLQLILLFFSVSISI
jgi:hypothetical protein